MRSAVRSVLRGATLACVGANASIVVADIARADFVVANSEAVGVPSAALPYLALLKGAGVAGLVLGLAGAKPVGLAASTGLVLFFVGAISAHLRAHVFHNIAFPTVFLVLAGGAVCYFTVS